MEIMWLRLPRLFFLYRSRSYLALPVMLSRPVGGFPPEHLSPGPNPNAMLRTLPSASASFFVTHAQSLPSSPSTASSNELGWQADGRRRAGSDEGMWTKKRPNKDSNVLIAVLPEIK